MVHDRDPLGEAGDDVHVVLDHEHRLALLLVQGADQLDQLRHVLGADAGHRLVEQDHPRVAASSIASSSLRLSPCESAPAGTARARRDRRAPSAAARPLDRLVHAGRAPPEPKRPAEARPRRRAARSRARSGAGRRWRSGTSARARRARRYGGCAGDVAAVQLDRPGGRPERPESRLKSEVLPAPFGPMMPRNSPSATSRGHRRRSSRRRCRARGASGEDSEGPSPERPSPATAVTGGWTFPGENRVHQLRRRTRRSSASRAGPRTSAGSARGPAGGSAPRPSARGTASPRGREIILSTSSPPPSWTARTTISAAMKPSGVNRSGAWPRLPHLLTSHVVHLVVRRRGEVVREEFDLGPTAERSGTRPGSARPVDDLGRVEDASAGRARATSRGRVGRPRRRRRRSGFALLQPAARTASGRSPGTARAPDDGVPLPPRTAFTAATLPCAEAESCAKTTIFLPTPSAEEPAVRMSW